MYVSLHKQKCLLTLLTIFPVRSPDLLSQDIGTEIKAGKFIVIVSGVDEEINHAQEILKNANHEVNEPVAV